MKSITIAIPIFTSNRYYKEDKLNAESLREHLTGLLERFENKGLLLYKGACTRHTVRVPEDVANKIKELAKDYNITILTLTSSLSNMFYY